MRRIAVLCSVACALWWAPAGVTTGAAAAVGPPDAGPLVRSDFNGDGFDDLAVGVPTEDVGFVSNAGAVNVIYGSAGGLIATGDQYWTQDSTDIVDQSETSDAFGTGVASGDFDRDGYDDLAIGVPAETVGAALMDAGGVSIIYGTQLGLSAEGNQFWTQNTSGIVDDSEPRDRFGASLAVGDFDSDGYDDLAIGIPGQLVGTAVVRAGAVSIIYGGPGGLSAAGNRMLTQDTPDIQDFAEEGDNFGIEVEAGDYDGDGYDDLAISARSEDVGSIVGAGAVHVVFGSSGGLTATGNQFWTQDTEGIPDAAERGDRFGGGLGGGDFNADGFDDLAIGVPAEDLDGLRNGGAVNVLYGEEDGLMALGSQFWTQDSDGIGDFAEERDVFGAPLAVADYDFDGFDDLAVGVTGEDVGIATNAGGVNVLYGSVDELTSSGNQFWTQDTGLEDTAEEGDAFGTALGVADFNGDGDDDLVVGVPSEDVGTLADAGAVNAVYGGSFGLTSSGNQLWDQDSTGIQDVAEPSDAFGGSAV